MSEFWFLIRMNWLSGRRSALWHQNVLINMLSIFSLGYIMINLLVLGWFIDSIFMSLFPNENPIYRLNDLLLYYVLIDLALRFYFQKTPILDIQPYLALPIGKSKLIHFTLSRGLLNAFSLFPFLIFIPFSSKIIYEYETELGAFTWIIGIYFILAFSTYFVMWLKRVSSQKPYYFIGFIVLLVLLLIGEINEWISIRPLSRTVFNAFVYQPWIVLVPVGAAFGMYFINFSWLKSRSFMNYVQAYIPESDMRSGDFSFLQRFGEIGEMLRLELKLILRNKRPRSVFLLSYLFVPYGLIFYGTEELNSYFLLFFAGIVVTGMFMLNYGQYLHSWESSFFDYLLTSPLTAKRYYETKFWLFFAGSCIAYVLCIPYVYFGWNVFLANTVMFLFNIGVNSYVVMFATSFGPKPLDLSKSTMWNLQGAGAAQFILTIPIFLLPMLVFTPFLLLNKQFEGLIALGTIGFAGVVTRNYWLSLLGQNLLSRKYSIAKNFREKS